MKKELIDIIKETADFYGIELVKVKDKKNAGIFLDIDGKKINVLDLSPDTIWDKLFDNSFINYDYMGKMTNNICFVKSKKINCIKKNIKNSFNIFEGKVA